MHSHKGLKDGAKGKFFFNWLCAERPSILMLNMNSIALKKVNLVGKQNKVTILSSGPVRETKQGFAPFFNNNLNLIKSQQMPHRPIQKVYCCWISSCVAKSRESSSQCCGLP